MKHNVHRGIVKCALIPHEYIMVQECDKCHRGERGMNDCDVNDLCFIRSSKLKP